MDTILAANKEQQPELMLSNVLHLMSHYHGQAACPKLAATIERHLQALSNLPGLAPVLQATCQQLSQQWAAMVETTTALPAPVRETWLQRLDRWFSPRAALPLAPQ